MRKIFAFCALLIPLGISCYFFRDSFVFKTTLSPPFSAKGVVFHDRLRATAGYHIVDHYLHYFRCSLAEQTSREEFTFPGSFCTILGSGAYVSYLEHQLTFWKADGLLGWEKKIHVHHDVSVNEKNGTIFVISGDFTRAQGEKAETRLDSVRGYDLKGDEIFYWGMKDHKSELEALLQMKLPRQFKDGNFQYTHFNSVEEIPETAASARNPAFRAGNILVNEYRYGIMFIVERKSKKIVWHHLMKDGARAHSVRMNEAGQIVFFSNRKWEKGAEQPSYSSIDYLDPLSGQIVHSITTNPREAFYDHSWGSLQPLPGDRFLVTHSHGGSAFEIDRNGRILWEWVNPRNNPINGPEPIYRVLLVPEERVDKMLSAWRPF